MAGFPKLHHARQAAERMKRLKNPGVWRRGQVVRCENAVFLGRRQVIAEGDRLFEQGARSREQGVEAKAEVGAQR